MGQCDENNGKLVVLMYWNATLSPAQSQWHPKEQEFWGLVNLKREVHKHFGRCPMILHTDHANIARIEGWDISRIDAKHFRWHAELVQDGSLLLYRAGTGALHRGPDALSRNPEHRDALILARTEEWTIHRLRIR